MDKGEQEFRYMEAIIQSMTKQERQDPQLLNASRRKRIAAGAGVTVARVNSLIKRYEETKKLMKQFSGGKMGKKGRRMFQGF
jgi:signal recognition particle subunit SRP54